MNIMNDFKLKDELLNIENQNNRHGVPSQTKGGIC